MTQRLFAWVALAALGGCVNSRDVTDSRQSSADAASANLQLGIAYLQQGNLATAKDKLERALEQNPRNPSVHTALGLLDERLNKDKEADAEYRTAERLAPSDPEILNNYAVYLCRRGRVDEGLQRFQQVAANPLSRTPWAADTNAGVCLRSAKRDAEAQVFFARALMVRPDDAEAVLQLAQLEFDQKQFGFAQRRIETFLSKSLATPDLLLLGWRIAQTQNDRVGAVRYALRLRQDFPQSDQARIVAGAAANPG